MSIEEISGLVKLGVDYGVPATVAAVLAFLFGKDRFLRMLEKWVNARVARRAAKTISDEAKIKLNDDWRDEQAKKYSEHLQKTVDELSSTALRQLADARERELRMVAELEKLRAALDRLSRELEIVSLDRERLSQEVEELLRENERLRIAASTAIHHDHH